MNSSNILLLEIILFIALELGQARAPTSESYPRLGSEDLMVEKALHDHAGPAGLTWEICRSTLALVNEAEVYSAAAALCDADGPAAARRAHSPRCARASGALRWQT